LFSWIFGIKKGWAELTHGADIRIPIIYKYIIKWVTPFMLLAVFIGSLLRPASDDWTEIGLGGWELHKESILGQIMHKGLGPNSAYFTDSFYAEQNGKVDSLYTLREKSYIRVTDTSGGKKVSSSYVYNPKHTLAVRVGSVVKTGDVIYTGSVTNKVFFVDISRFLLFFIFVLIGLLVFVAFRKRKRENTI
jgi:hypothetical protein